MTTACPVCAGAGLPCFQGRDFLRARPGERYDYLRCPLCGVEYQHPMPDGATIAGYYSEDYAVHQEARPKETGWLERWVLAACHGYRHPPLAAWQRGVGRIAGLFFARQALEYVAGGRLLDVGCGNGQFLHRQQGLGWQVAGVDFSPQAVAACQTLGLEQVRLGDLVEAGFADGSFDLITMRHVLEHLPEPHAWLREIHRLLKPGGRLLIQTPNARALGRPWFGIHWFANDVPRHLVLYAPGNLTRLVAGHGFRVESLTTDTSPKIILNSLDWRRGRTGIPSRKISWRRFLAKFYVLAAQLTGRGDELRLLCRKG